jgi:site-specific recombinase XerD
MMDQYFEDPAALKRASASWSGPYLDGYSEWLRDRGFAWSSIQTLARTAVHIGLWSEHVRSPICDLDEAALERFGAHLRRCRCPGPRPKRRRIRKIVMWAGRFIEYLRVQGVVRDRLQVPTVSHPLVAGFDAWMRAHRGATPTTLLIYGRVVANAVSALGDDPSTFAAHGLRRFVLEKSQEHGRSKAKQVMTAMRAFLRFLVATGACSPGLDGAIPTIAHWRLSALPRYLSSAEVDQIIATCDRSTLSGARNHAILLLLVRLGLRAGDVAALCHEDIDWRHGTISVAGKSRRASRLPLPQEVGDAILAYLSRRRPRSPGSSRVFLRVASPVGPITHSAVTCIAARAIRVARVASPSRGAHVLRHTAASELIRKGASLEQVRLVLRHRDPETTRLYAKIDLALLQQVAQAWPGVTPC